MKNFIIKKLNQLRQRRMNNRGWIRIVEAFFSILLIAGVLLIVFNKGYLGGEDISSRVYDLQLSVLREIELDDDLRQKILDINDYYLPMEDDHDNFPKEITDRIDARIPDSLTCRSKICELNVICELNKYSKQDIYAQSVAITATIDIYSPRKLVLFCWSD
jgi:hypothetical protein